MVSGAEQLLKSALLRVMRASFSLKISDLSINWLLLRSRWSVIGPRRWRAGRLLSMRGSSIQMPKKPQMCSNFWHLQIGQQ